MTDYRSWPIVCCIDPHPRKPFFMGWARITPHGEIIFFREWPDFDFFSHKSWDWSLDQYIEEIRRIEASFAYRDAQGVQHDAWIPYRILDPNSGRTPNIKTGRRLDEEFAIEDLFFDTTVDDDLDSGHIAVRAALKDKRLFVTEDCPNIIKGFELYIWDEWGGKSEERGAKETPRDKYKDPMDVVRYTVMFDPQFIEVSQLRQRFDMRQFANGGLGRSRWVS